MGIGNRNKSQKESVVPQQVHKSSGSAVPDGKDYNIALDPEEHHVWFVAILQHQKYTTSCCDYIEKTLSGACCFVPSKEELHVYPNRTRRKVRKYVIPRFVFVTGITEDEAYYFVPQWTHVDLFMPDRARARTGGHVPLARITHREMLQLQKAINGSRSADDITFSTDDLKFDEQIEVVSGELRGLEGGYYKDAGNDYLVFMLGKLGNIKVRVSIADCSLKK